MDGSLLVLLHPAVRPILVYLLLLSGLRLAGKRKLVELSPIDLVLLLVVSYTLLLGSGWIGATALFVVHIVAARFFRSPEQASQPPVKEEKKPAAVPVQEPPRSPDDARYQEVLQRLDGVSRDVKTALGMIRVIRG